MAQKQDREESQILAEQAQITDEILLQEQGKRQFIIWTEEEDDILKKVFAHLQSDEIMKLIPNRTWASIEKRAHRLGLKKTPEYKSAVQASNRSLTGVTHFADFAVDTLGKKYPDIKKIYDDYVAELLSDPNVDITNRYVVQQIKKAALFEATQIILLKDRLEAELKGKQLMVNPVTGNETWVETRYLHNPDIHADFKTARQILKDLGIITGEPARVDVTTNINFLWEESDPRAKLVHEVTARQVDEESEDSSDETSEEDSIQNEIKNETDSSHDKSAASDKPPEQKGTDEAQA